MEDIFWIRLNSKRWARHHVVSLIYDALIRREGKTVGYAHLIAALRVRSVALSLFLLPEITGTVIAKFAKFAQVDISYLFVL